MKLYVRSTKHISINRIQQQLYNNFAKGSNQSWAYKMLKMVLESAHQHCILHHPKCAAAKQSKPPVKLVHKYNS